MATDMQASVLLLNFAHPFTDEQLEQIVALLGATPTVREVAVQVDRTRPLAEVAVELADGAGLDPRGWQTARLVVNPPSLAPVALALLAEIHGRSGFFPPVLNVRPIAGSTPPRYEVAEVVNLQSLRDAARQRR